MSHLAAVNRCSELRPGGSGPQTRTLRFKGVGAESLSSDTEV